MTDDSLLPFDLPAVRRKKVTADFGGGLISSDDGLVLLHEAERRLRLADTLADCVRDRRDPATVVHRLPALLRFRMSAIACGYEDVDDCDALRTDPLFKMDVGRVLCSQPTMSWLENAPPRIEVARMTASPSARVKIRGRNAWPPSCSSSPCGLTQCMVGQARTRHVWIWIESAYYSFTDFRTS